MCSHTYISYIQFGFRKDGATPSFCSSLHTIGIFHFKSTIKWPVFFFDFAKAFESVPHQALLNKLHQLIIPPAQFQWLSNYLSDRFQWVVLNGTCTSWLPVTSGVPQGSIWGPLMFLLYVNDIPNVPFTKDSPLVMYADDLLLFKPISKRSFNFSMWCEPYFPVDPSKPSFSKLQQD